MIHDCCRNFIGLEFGGEVVHAKRRDVQSREANTLSLDPALEKNCARAMAALESAVLHVARPASIDGVGGNYEAPLRHCPSKTQP